MEAPDKNEYTLVDDYLIKQRAAYYLQNHNPFTNENTGYSESLYCGK